MRVSFGLILCALAFDHVNLAEVPRVDTANFSPNVKAQLEQAEAEAKARPQDGQTVGRLGMILHAYHQYDAAAKAYSHARGLEPQNFDWASLLGQAELAEGHFELAANSFRSALE